MIKRVIIIGQYPPLTGIGPFPLLIKTGPSLLPHHLFMTDGNWGFLRGNPATRPAEKRWLEGTSNGLLVKGGGAQNKLGGSINNSPTIINNSPLRIINNCLESRSKVWPQWQGCLMETPHYSLQQITTNDSSHCPLQRSFQETWRWGATYLYVITTQCRKIWSANSLVSDTKLKKRGMLVGSGNQYGVRWITKNRINHW